MNQETPFEVKIPNGTWIAACETQDRALELSRELAALRATCAAVAHQLEHGEARDGDARDLAWCVRELREAAGGEGR